MQHATFKVATGSMCPEYWLNVFIKILFVLHIGQTFSSVLGGDSLWSMTTACYGSDLECSTFIVQCNSNHRIVVGSMEYAVKETWPCVFGVSDCQRLEKTCCTFDTNDKKIPFYDADVVATHRLCSGRQQCQVEVPRIVEGSSISNYGVMHYKCMEGKKVVDMCSKGIHRGKDLYLMFDGNVYIKSSYYERGSMDCTCKIISTDCSSRILFSISDIRMLQPDNNFHQGCSRSTLHISNKTITCNANSSTGTSPSIGNDAFNSVSYMSTVNLRNLFLHGRFDIPEFVLLSLSVQDINFDILVACNVDAAELRSTNACITVRESTKQNYQSGSSTTPKVAPNLQHTTWSSNTSTSFSLLPGGHNAEGANLEIKTTKGNIDKTVSSQSTMDWVTADYSPHEIIPNGRIRDQSTRATELDFNHLVGKQTSMSTGRKTVTPEPNGSTSKQTEGPRSTLQSMRGNSETSKDFINTFSTFLMDTNIHNTSEKSERRTTSSRHFGVTLKRPEANPGAGQHENSTSLSSEGTSTRSPSLTISWYRSRRNAPPRQTTRKIPLFSPIRVANLPGYLPSQLKTLEVYRSTKSSDTNNGGSDLNVGNLKTTKHPVPDWSTTASNSELTTETKTSKKNKPQGNSYVLVIIGGVVAFLLVVAVIAVFIYIRKRNKNGPTRFKRPLFYPSDSERKKNPPISSFGDALAGRNRISMREDPQVTGTTMSHTSSQETECKSSYAIYEAVDFQDSRERDQNSSNSGSSSDGLYAKIKRVRESITKF